MLNEAEFKEHLINDLLPFWNNLYDKEYGGFYGRVDGNNKIDKHAPKAAVLQTRILWFYSSCYTFLKDEKLLEFARRQFDFISKHMLDPDGGGIYWSVEYDGKIKDNSKRTYASAFALYALSAYYSVSRDNAALIAADKIFNLTEDKFKDGYGYLEASVSEGFIPRTMNTLLHIIEAYSEYYSAVKSEKARSALRYALNLVISKAYNGELSRIECYFDEFMNPVGDMLSYGHDIEASWLIYRACEILADDNIMRNLAPKLEKVAQNVISKGFAGEGKDGLYYECKNGVDNKTRSWWVMSEAIVALVHRYNLYKDDKSMIMAENLWEYVKKYYISPYGEWYTHVKDDGGILKGSGELCGAWKCPYHNGRMCLELI